MSSSANIKPNRRRKLPPIPPNSGKLQLELKQRQHPARVDVERLNNLPPHILQQLKTVENDPAILTGKVHP